MPSLLHNSAHNFYVKKARYYNIIIDGKKIVASAAEGKSASS
jgi:hypothetical protein